MADPDGLTGGSRPGPLVPAGVARAFRDGEERLALQRLTRGQAGHAEGGVAWAVLERLRGLVLIHMLREVEGTFALERADAVLDASGVGRPGLDDLDALEGGEGLEGLEDTPGVPRPPRPEPGA